MKIGNVGPMAPTAGTRCAAALHAAFIAACLLLPLAGCTDLLKRGVQQVMPVPAIVESRIVVNVLVDNDAVVKIRNTGASGYIRLKLTSNTGRQWSTREHFNAGEEREIRLALPGHKFDVDDVKLVATPDGV